MVEIRSEQIREEARKILEEFAKSLSKIKIDKKTESIEVGGFREEGSGQSFDESFRKKMFENAPEKDGDFIIEEKKQW